ncbi:spore germination protein GerW family protein [Georgenia muralis]|uniref:Sporulation protein YtfJ n=1 Tax=Georgenia muralis TaxID=154117 RepID=A0A3N4Z4X7_9MICO|nr:spore germination protein GerW family protein [Georgenia muralis]RPF26796.1 sporulation protein YtfJ [Georgenia muralis]
MREESHLRTLAETLRDAPTVRRAFGEAHESDGATVIPVATVLGAGGLGYGSGGPDAGPAAGEGGGGGHALRVRPLGVYVIRAGEVTWQPVTDPSRVILGGQVVGALALLLLARALRRR